MKRFINITFLILFILLNSSFTNITKNTNTTKGWYWVYYQSDCAGVIVSEPIKINTYITSDPFFINTFELDYIVKDFIKVHKQGQGRYCNNIDKRVYGPMTSKNEAIKGIKQLLRKNGGKRKCINDPSKCWITFSKKEKKSIQNHFN